MQRVSVLKDAGENIPLIAETSGFLAGAQVATLAPRESVFIIYITDGSFSTVYALDILVLSAAVDFDVQGEASTLNAGQDQLFIL